MVTSNTIRFVRESKGIKAKDLAHRIGCSASALTMIETGKRRLSHNWMIKISQALDCTIEDLIQSKVSLEMGSDNKLHIVDNSLIHKSSIHKPLVNTPEPDNNQDNTLPKEIINTIQEMVIQEKASLSHKKQFDIGLKTLYCLMQDFKPEEVTKDVILGIIKAVSLCG